MATRVLITGGAGFIGHHLINKFLRETDWEVVSLDRLDTSGCLSRLSDMLDECPKEWRKRVKIIWHDLKSPLNSLIRNQIGKIDYIFHLAAGSHVDRSIQYPLEFVMDNVVGTCNLLDYARLYCDSLKWFLYFSTDEVFGPAPEGVFFREWDRYNSGNPYSGSKAAAEELCLAYQNTYNLPISITHTMNLFGIRQHPEKYIPLVIRKILLKEKVYIHANKECVEPGKRHYLHTEDLTDAILFLIDKAQKGEKYNIAGKQELDNLQLAQLIAKIIGKPLDYQLVDFHSSRPGHDLRYALDGSKMEVLGWTPKKDLEKQLVEVVNWTIQHPIWFNI